jgi:hypothetical protein
METGVPDEGFTAHTSLNHAQSNNANHNHLLVPGTARWWLTVLLMGSLPGASAATIADAAHMVRKNEGIAKCGKSLQPHFPKVTRIANAASHGIIWAFTTGLVLERLLKHNHNLRESPGSASQGTTFTDALIHERQDQGRGASPDSTLCR